MVSKAIPIIIVVILVLALGLSYFFYVQKEIDIPLPYQERYHECVEGNEAVHAFMNAMKDNDVSQCTGLINEDVCRAILTKDISLCNEIPSCIATITRDPEKCGGDYSCRALMLGEKECEGFDSVEEASLYHGCLAYAAQEDSYFKSNKAKEHCRDEAIYVGATSDADCSHLISPSLKESCFSRFR